MTVVVIIICLAIVLIEIVFLMISNKKNHEENNRQRAAANIARDMQLELMLRNPFSPDAQNAPAPDLHNFICLTQINSQTRHEYVFSLNDMIRIGRAKNDNQLIVNDGLVSEYHCVIYRDPSGIYVRDLNSANGLSVKSGFSSACFVNNGGIAALRTGSRLTIGSMEYLIRLVYLEDF